MGDKERHEEVERECLSGDERHGTSDTVRRMGHRCFEGRKDKV